jgi:hypothetical protein
MFGLPSASYEQISQTGDGGAMVPAPSDFFSAQAGPAAERTDPTTIAARTITDSARLAFIRALLSIVIARIDDPDQRTETLISIPDSHFVKRHSFPAFRQGPYRSRFRIKVYEDI